MVSVAVVLVTYESAGDLAACLGSLPAAAGPHELEVVVVDNASRDASAEIARRLGVKVLENPTNLGLSRAIDIGAAATGAPWLLVVNPDTRLAAASGFRLGFPRSFLESDHVRGLVFGDTFHRISDHRRRAPAWPTQ